MMSNYKSKIKQTTRDRLFYDTYKYSCKFIVPELSALRELDHKRIDYVIQLRKNNESRFTNFGGSWSRYQRPITDQIIMNLHQLCDLLLAQTDSFKFTISGDIGHIYTNNTELLDSFNEEDFIKILSYREACLNIPRNSIQIKRSNYSSRTYFKTQRVTLEEKERLKDIFQQNDIRVGPSFTEWLTKFPLSKYVSDNYFIDHNTNDILTLLSLATGIKIKKTLTIISDK